MGVKTIFKVLLGTIVVVVFSILIIEALNVATYSAQINQLVRLSTKKACNLFCNETYRENIGLLDKIYDSNGNEVIGGNIYGQSNNSKDIYDDLYRNNSNFSSWYNKYGKGIWDNLDILAAGLGIGGTKQADMQIAEYFAESLVTPINMGVTYLDDDVVTHIMRWNLTKILSNGQEEVITKDEHGRHYVKYKGFRVYTPEAIISTEGDGSNNYGYKLLDVNSNADEIKNATKLDNLEVMDFENDKVLLVGIRYDVPIAYEGITPLGKIISFAASKRVEGFDDIEANKDSNKHVIADVKLVGGGLDGSNIKDPKTGNKLELPISGKLTFIIVK